MASTKYYDGIAKAQADLKMGDPLPPFDMQRLRTGGIFGRIVQRFLENPRWALRLLRRFAPNVKLGPFVFVTRAADVRDVLERHEEFETPFGPEMKETTRHVAVLLGLPEGELYRSQKSAVLSAFPPDEMRRRAGEIAAVHAGRIMADAQPGFDAIGDLFRVVPARICRDYYGLAIDDERAFTDWAIALSTLYFGDHFGSRTVRELALAASVRMAATIDLSIDRAIEKLREPGSVAATPLERLVARHLDKAIAMDRLDIRALMFGMVTGFVPTNILAAGNALDVILNRPEARSMLTQAVAAGDGARVERILMEAMRFKPINPGPVRYAVRDATIGPKDRPYAVKARTTLWVSTLSAMFDEREITAPETFNPDRPGRDQALVFGHGLHWCIGAWLAQAQISACLAALFAKQDMRRAPGGDGRLRRLGPFPESLGVTFATNDPTPPGKHALGVIACPLRPDAKTDELRRSMAAFGNPAHGLGAAFREAGDTVHFVSATLSLPPPGAGRADEPDHLVVEFSADGEMEEAFAALAKALGADFRAAIAGHVDIGETETLEAFFRRRAIPVGAWPSRPAGALFDGTPGHTVKRIRAEAEFERAAAQALKEVTAQANPPPLETLRQVRARLASGPHAALLQPSANGLETNKVVGVLAWLGQLGRALAAVLAAAALLPMIANFVLLLPLADSWPGRIAIALAAAVLTPLEWLVVLGIPLGLLYLALRYREKRDAASEEMATLSRYEDAARLENGGDGGQSVVQNHLAAISMVKAGLVRSATLRLVFLAVGVAARNWFKPGFLADINSIHFARWVRLPGTRRLLFLSNYGGSWESYLEDFITKATAGLTAVWSNTAGFPRTKRLVLDGARDAQRFKRWARLQQVPTLMWYSAYPEINTRRIRINAAIREGLARPAGESEARDWLTLFGSLPRPPRSLETDDIQGLFFGPFGPLTLGRLLALAIPAATTRAARRGWLEEVLPRLTFGDHKPAGRAAVAAFGPDGLIRLGLGGARDEGPLEAFAHAFRQGMDAGARARVLDDVGDSAPAQWIWGAGDTKADVVLLVYAESVEDLEAQAELFRATSLRAGFAIVQDLPLAVLGEEGSKHGKEHFGFADGISQPIVEGTPRARGPVDPVHGVAAGEFLFGYPDGRGETALPLAMPPDSDGAGLLPSAYPSAHSSAGDFGRNGSYLVVRQLEQHVEAFDDYCRKAAAQLGQGQKDMDAEWVAAKIVGRWKDGSSLVRNPHRESGKDADNAFRFGAEDPQGLRCPLGSHIRRTNPRDSLGPDRDVQLSLANRHRLLRVGRPYQTASERGLLFMCLNADLERQFEFVQQTWVSAGSFHGLRREKDPLIGANGDGQFTLATPAGGKTFDGLPAFVRTRGGGYFFMPGRRALSWMLARLGPG